MPLAMIPHKWMTSREIREGTHDAITRFIAETLEKLTPGHLPDDWSAAFFAWQGDLKARKEARRFSQSFMHSYCCDKCLAQQPHRGAVPQLLYGDFSDSAGHRGTRMTQKAYLSSNMHKLSPWARIPGWTLDLTLLDAMHVVFLGIARDHVASHLTLWVELGFCTPRGAVPMRRGLMLATAASPRMQPQRPAERSDRQQGMAQPCSGEGCEGMGASRAEPLPCIAEAARWTTSTPTSGKTSGHGAEFGGTLQLVPASPWHRSAVRREQRIQTSALPTRPHPCSCCCSGSPRSLGRLTLARSADSIAKAWLCGCALVLPRESG
jgi:hypothetical protein